MRARAVLQVQRDVVRAVPQVAAEKNLVSSAVAEIAVRLVRLAAELLLRMQQ